MTVIKNAQVNCAFGSSGDSACLPNAEFTSALGLFFQYQSSAGVEAITVQNPKI